MPNIYNVVTDVHQTVLTNYNLTYDLRHRGNGRYVLYLTNHNSIAKAKLEFIISCDPNTPDETDVTGSVIRFGSLGRNVVSVIMDAIMERL
jgi:hypothetical protein